MQNLYIPIIAFESALLASIILYLAWMFNNARDSELLKLAKEEIIDFSEYGYLLFDRQGHFLKANRTMSEFFPMVKNPDEKNFSLKDFFSYLFDHSVDFDRSVKNTIFEQADDKQRYEFCEVIKSRKGALCYVCAKTLGDGFTAFIARDISQGQKREEHIIDLGRYNEQLIQAVQASTSGIIISDPKLEENPVIFYNKSLKGFLGKGYEDVGRTGWKAIFGALKGQEEKKALLEALSKQDEEVEVRIKDDGGELRWFSIKITPVADANGDLDLVIGIFNEITLLKQRESEIAHAQKMDALGRLSAGIAHDFNNVLSIIDGFGKMASMEVDANSKAAHYMERIHSASKRGAALTRKMLTFSKHKVVSSEVIDLRPVVKTQAELLMPLLGASVGLDVRMPEREVPIICSNDSIEQIIMNLVINARDAMPDGGKILIKISIPETGEVPHSIKERITASNYARITVADTGIGMNKETLERIFDPFFTTKEAGKGTGLGMSVVYGLINEAGGAINISSALGKGTCMEVYFPLSEEKVTKKIMGDEDNLSKICLDGYTALVAEDEPDLRLLVSGLLEGMGLEVITAENGDDALVKQDEFEGDIDILLTDVVMPSMNGVKLAEFFSEVSPKTKVIFMSGYPANGDMAPVNLPEDSCFIAKPVDYDNLARLLLRRLKEDQANTSEIFENMPRWKTSESAEKKEGQTHAV